MRVARESGKATEYEKRQWSTDNEYIHPYYTLQAYVSYDVELLSLAVIKTEDLMQIVKDGYGINRVVQEHGRNVTFRAIKWSDVEA